MKEEIIMEEKIKLFERELVTLTEKIDSINTSLKEIEDLKQEIKGLKVFIGRVHADFKSELPEIIRKISKKT